ncbi:MAG: MBOAT family protein [Methanotrichaceae archaeon]
MILISAEYLIFLTSIIIIVLGLKIRQLQIAFLLIASYYFYLVSNDYRILSLVFSSAVTYYCGNAIYRTSSQNKKKFYLALALFGALGQLAVFKYYNFAVDLLNQISSPFGHWTPIQATSLVIPIGISFYTFQSLSYVFDIYRGDLKAARSFYEYALFVAFFPQITSGPIIRARVFLTQLWHKTSISIESQNLKYGLTLIGIGLVKKMVLADNIGPYVDTVFSHPAYFNSLRIILATIAFGIQLYCDFSGYSDIAIGIARILGFVFPPNFNNPYLATDPSDFWTRWHISLSSFLRDYLYIPLGGNRKGELRTYLNLMITMTLCGFWHGAAWNFIIWGAYHGSLLSIQRLLSEGLLIRGRLGNTLKNPLLKAPRILITQYFIFFGWLIFRADSLDNMIYCMNKFIFPDFFSRITYLSLVYGFLNEMKIYIVALSLYILLLAFYRDRFCKVDWVTFISSLKLRYWTLFLIIVILIIAWFSPSTSSRFIYSAF